MQRLILVLLQVEVEKSKYDKASNTDKEMFSSSRGLQWRSAVKRGKSNHTFTEFKYTNYRCKFIFMQC